jgi:hypothetical protein
VKSGEWGVKSEEGEEGGEEREGRSGERWGITEGYI